MNGLCIDCGKLCRGKRCLGCYHKYMKSEEYRRAQSDRQKAVRTRPEYHTIEYHEKLSRIQKEAQNRPDVLITKSKVMKAAHARGCFNHVYTEEWRQRLPGIGREALNNPDTKQKHREAVRAACAQIDYEKTRQKRSEIQKIAQMRPEVRKKRSDSVKAAYARGAYMTKECREIRSRAQKMSQNRPEVREKKSKAIKAAWARGVYAEMPAKVSGERSGMWRGGHSRDPYVPNWSHIAKAIRKRDGYRCAFCGEIENGYHYPVHHIDYDPKNNDPANLVTLCLSHHCMTTSGNRKYWQTYYSGRGFGFIQGIC